MSQRTERALALARYPHLMPDRGLYRVHLGPGPAYDTPYTDLETRPFRVYWFGPAVNDAELLHEFGHIVQKAYVPDDQFGVFKPFLGGPQHRPIWWKANPMSIPARQPDAFCEAFADTFQWMQTATVLNRDRRAEFRRLLRPFIINGPLEVRPDGRAA